jgi:hypothetical protein
MVSVGPQPENWMDLPARNHALTWIKIYPSDMRFALGNLGTRFSDLSASGDFDTFSLRLLNYSVQVMRFGFDNGTTDLKTI